MATSMESRESWGPVSGPADRDGMLRRYYAGEAAPCPVGCGGTAEIVRASATDSGGGELWFECTSCAQRERYDIPPATAAEKQRTRAVLVSGREAACERHIRPVALQRRGRQRVCPQCKVLYED